MRARPPGAPGPAAGWPARDARGSPAARRRLQTGSAPPSSVGTMSETSVTNLSATPDQPAVTVGSPVWIDYTAVDFPAQRAFYEALFGWTFEDQGEEYGHYMMIRKDDATVGGAMDAADLPPAPEGMPPAVWTVYLKTEDIDRTMELVAEHGGTVVNEPMDVGPLGRMAIVESAGGEALGFWEPGEFPGHDLPLTPGTSVWFEVMSTDVAADAAFYRNVAGWDVVPMRGDAPDDDGAAGDVDPGAAGEGPAYATNFADEDSTAGLCDATPWLPEGTPSYWRPYFQVTDMEEAVRVVAEHGGRVVDGPMDSPFGVVASVLDPAGATFQLNQPPRG